ncbi:DNA-binding transcriptional repressor AcrR, partial [Klebsiella michiganensis]
NAFDLQHEARAYVETLLEMYQLCPSLRSSEGAEA